MAVRVRQLLAAGDTRILLGGAGPDGIAVLRFRPAIWSSGLECYLAELYVAPAERGRGLGRALMEAAIALARDAGADTMDLGTNETDTVARGLYESLGFTQLEDGTWYREESADMAKAIRAGKFGTPAAVAAESGSPDAG